MSKEKMVDNIIANTAWTEEDREYLMEQNEDHLKKMVPVVNDAPPVEKKPEPETKAQAPVDNEKPVTLQEFIGNAPAEIREVLEDSLQTHVARKDALIATITANAKNTFTKDALSAMKVSDLQAIANLAQKEEDKKAMVANYGGMAPVGNAADEEPLEAPVMNFGSDA